MYLFTQTLMFIFFLVLSFGCSSSLLCDTFFLVVGPFAAVVVVVDYLFVRSVERVYGISRSFHSLSLSPQHVSFNVLTHNIFSVFFNHRQFCGLFVRHVLIISQVERLSVEDALTQYVSDVYLKRTFKNHRHNPIFGMHFTWTLLFYWWVDVYTALGWLCSTIQHHSHTLILSNIIFIVMLCVNVDALKRTCIKYVFGWKFIDWMHTNKLISLSALQTSMPTMLKICWKRGEIGMNA